MATRTWDALFRSVTEDGAQVQLEELVQDGAPVARALILTVTDEDGSTGWASLAYGDLAELHAVLGQWLAR